MVALFSERDEMSALTRLSGKLYAQVDAHFDHSYLPKLLMDGLARDLPDILRNNPLFAESDGENHILHVGSIKLVLYKNFCGRHSDLFGIQMMTASGPGGTGECIAVQFYCNPRGNMRVEYTMATKYHGPDRFDVEVPSTAGHTLNKMLGQLRGLVDDAFLGGHKDEDMRPILQWAEVA